jgi:dienelactone hydrolase
MNSSLLTRSVFSVSVQLIALSIFPAVARAQSEEQPPMQVLETPNKTRFGLFGNKPTAPAPTIFVFAIGVDAMDDHRSYSETGRLLSKHGWLYVTVDLPCHGRDHRPSEPENLSGWAHRVSAGQDLAGPFVERCADVLDYLVEHGYTDRNRVAACGTSRGGFCALHFAAGDRRIRTVVCVSPVTNLLALREFIGVDKVQVQRFNVDALAEKLANKSIWISIGDDDQRVSTADCIATVAKLKSAAANPQSIELVVKPTKGHEPIKNAYSLAAEFVRMVGRSP